MVGEHDVATGPQLRTGGDVDRQGPNRSERARCWYEHLQAEATNRGLVRQASFEALPGTGHDIRQAASAGGYVERVAAFLGDRHLATGEA
jgi:hypothetical protein